MESITEKLQKLQRQYSQQLPKKILQLEEKWQCVTDRGNQKVLDSLLRDTHHLAGSGEIYGYHQISKTAQELQQILVNVIKSQRQPNAEEQGCIKNCINALHLAARD